MSKIRECFTSRYDGGRLLEADYSQLEIIALAHLSGDKRMHDDILAGVDLHTIRARQMYATMTITPKQRQVAKVFSFQLQYGAGAVSMAASCGVEVGIAKKFIKDYYDRYPQVKKWQEEVAAEYMKRRKPSQQVTKNGVTAGMGYHLSITGRRYVMYEDDNPYAGQHKFSGGVEPATNFSPTKMKNYPVQGFATGDIVPMMLGEVFDFVHSCGSWSRYKLINTVHDSILFDVNPVDHAELKLFASKLTEVMEGAPALLKKKFDIDFALPLKVDIKVGKSWGSMKELSLRT
jgi:Autographiviridae DNA polymerase